VATSGNGRYLQRSENHPEQMVSDLSSGNLTCSYVKNDKAEKGNILKMGKTEDVRRDREVS
jgi:hypothetical protein